VRKLNYVPRHVSIPEVTLRPVTLADIEIILRHRREMFREMGGHYDELLDRFELASRSYFQIALTAGGYYGVFAELRGEVVAGGGIVIVDWPGSPLNFEPTRVWILNIYVEPRERRRGFARLIVETLIDWCRRNGFRSVALHAGYGAYGISQDPYFDPRNLAWLERGGVLAFAHVRGGGEYGEDWHLAGKQLTKPNTWKDFIACAEYLIKQKYTSPARLAIEGGSAGGITVGRSITERPDLFAAAIDAVPMSDVVRAEFTPNGPPNIPEFGTVKQAQGFKALYEMSPYHHIKDRTPYPAVMITTGFNDPRVISWEPGKMAARLQAATSSGRPVLLRVDYDAGHGIGSTKTQREQEMADEMSFALWQFRIPEFQPERM